MSGNRWSDSCCMENQMQNGYVALLDVLGFSTLAMSDGDGGRLQKYLATLQSEMKNFSESFGVKYVAFSDTIVLTTAGESDEDLFALVMHCSGLLSRLLAHEIPIRGAIAYGRFLRVPGEGGGLWLEKRSQMPTN